MPPTATKRAVTEFVEFSDWMTVEEAARALTKTPSRIRQMIEEGRWFSEVAKIGTRPVYLLLKKEVRKLADDERKAMAAKTARLDAARGELRTGRTK